MIGQAFFPSDNVLVSDLASAATFGVGFVARPLGGALIGAYGDRAGRKPAMTLSIGLMAIGSVIIAFTPGYADDWGPGADPPDHRAPLSRICGRRRSGPATMFLLEAAPRDRRMLFASWQLASQNLSSLLGGLIGLMLALALSQSSLNAWGWRVPFAFGVLIAPVGIYYSQPARGDARKAAARTRARHDRDSLRCHSIQLARRAARSRAHQRGHDHPIFSYHHDALCDPHASFASVVRHAWRDHARDHRLPWRAHRRSPGRSLGHTPGRDRIPHWADDRLVSGDEVSRRQSKRHNARSGDYDPELAACGGRRRRRCADAVDLSARHPLDRPRADLRARRCDLWRHGDLRRSRGSSVSPAIRWLRPIT